MSNSVIGAARVAIDAVEIEMFRNSGVLVLDTARTRPLYFDGRFLTAADLTRDQQYVRARQADLARAGGFGVVSGLGVSLAADGSGRRLRIAAGHGVTPAGETVMLAAPREIDLGDVATIERLDASFGLRKLPSASAGARSGIFVLALRPVEFSANPIASYPTSLTGQRAVHDGDIVEAAAVCLIPYNDNGAAERYDLRRARVAREIFVEGSTQGVPQEALPLAMVALDRGVLQWVDVFLVRREVGAESPLQTALGGRPRATREAWLLQYTRHLGDVLAARDGAQQGRRFAAATYFQALPPAGPLPAATIDSPTAARSETLQYYFPASVDVELSFLPSDEVAALVEDSLTLPPIDLTASDEELDATAVLVVMPVSRPKLRELQASLTSVSRAALPAAPGLLAKRRPLEVLHLVRRPMSSTVAPVAPDQAAWARAIAEVGQANDGMLWYVRRRNLAYRGALAGAALPLAGNDAALEARLGARLRALRLAAVVAKLHAKATSAAAAEMTALLGSDRVVESDVLLPAAVSELAAAARGGALEHSTVLAIARRYGDRRLGEGLAALERLQPKLAQARLRGAIVGSGMVPELDAKARRLLGREQAAFAQQMVEAAGQGPAAVRRLV